MSDETRAEQFVLKYGFDFQTIDKSPKIFLLKTERHGIDRKVATQLIILKGSVFDNRIAGITGI